MKQIPNITITDSFDAAVLICLLLKLHGEFNEQQLVSILTLDEMVGAFTISGGLDLIEKKSLAEKSAEGFYVITEAGKGIADEFFKRIPTSIRQKSLLEAKKIRTLTELRKSVHWDIEKRGSGYLFKIRFLNEMGGDDIMDLKLYAPSYESALIMQENFLSKPIESFERIMYLFNN